MVKKSFFTINYVEKIEYYACNIDTIKVKEVQNRIDVWHDKGELKIKRGNDIYRKSDMIYDIITKEYVGKEKCLDGCCSFDDVDMYQISYYEYQKHPLSIRCDELLNAGDEIGFSYVIRQLVEFDSDDQQELQFQKQILQSMNFQRQNLNYKEVEKLYNQKLIEKYSWLETSFKKINILKEIKDILISSNESIFAKLRIKRYLLKNLPFSM